MRNLFILVIISAALVANASAAVPVQTKVCSAVSAVGGLNCTFTSTPGSNSLIVGFVRTVGCVGTQTAFSWQDNKGNTWQADKYQQLSASAGRGVGMGSGIAASTSATFTVTALTNTSGSTCSYWSMEIAEYASMATTSWVDGTPVSASSGTGNALSGSCGSVTPSGANTVIVTGIGITANVNEAGYSLNSGFTVDASDLGGAAFHSSAIGHLLTSSVSSFTPGWSWSSNNFNWAAICTIYKQSSFGAGSSNIKRRFVGIGQ